jgi:hypothetical protein
MNPGYLPKLFGSLIFDILKIAVEWVGTLLHFWEAPSSNAGQEISYPSF